MSKDTNECGDSDVFFTDQFIRVLSLDGVTENERKEKLKKLFAESDNLLVKRVLNSETTFIEVIKPLLEEHYKLGVFSFFSTICFSYEFIKLGKKIKKETAGVIDMERELVLGFGSRKKIQCDITTPISRSAIAKKAFFQTLPAIGLSVTALLLVLFYGTSANVIALGNTSIWWVELMFYSIPLLLFLCIQSNYLSELACRIYTCNFVTLQAMEMDEIVQNIFLSKD